MEAQRLFISTYGIESRCRTSKECMAWKRTGCVECVAAQQMPGTFSELESLLAAENGCPIILWLTKKMFIAKDTTKLFSCMYDKTKGFPKSICYIYTTSLHDMNTIVGINVYTSSLHPYFDGQGFLEQLGKYRDFTPRFRSFHSSSGSQRYISPCFLENVLQDAQAKIEFHFVSFETAREGRAFPTFGRNVNVAFMGCGFSSDAADAFLQGMITKSDHNVGLTGMTIGIWMAFSEEILLTLLRMNVLDTYKVTGIFTSNLSDEALRAV